jgi:aldehyde:ferredoxin oxidoreductase
MENEKIYGWAGSILKVDLGTGIIRRMNKDDDKYKEYTRKFIGGKGLNHRLAWDELRPGTMPLEKRAFHPDNCLFISVGPLTGTAAPGSGRATIGGISAQSYPEMYAHSGVGGWFGATLKYAGVDAIIIKGKSPFYIDDENVNIKRADDLWGLGTYDTQRLLKQKHGQEVHTLCIGPAGENLSRIAVLLTDTENAAGQGGFGGVAGSKNLKAICIKGSRQVNIADAEGLLKLRKDNMQTREETPLMKNVPFIYDEQATADLPFGINKVSCSHSCDRHCFWNFHDVPGVTRPSLQSGKWGCVGAEAAGWQAPFHVNWPLWGKVAKTKPGLVSGPIAAKSARAGFEASRLFNQYGVNAWDLVAGIVPWLVMADRTGVIKGEEKKFKEILPIDADDPEWWVKLIKVITYRKGAAGELLSQGNYRAINKLGSKFKETIYSGHGKKIPTKISLQAAWGYAGHWSGRGIHSGLEFPYYLCRALPWMTASRDPMDDTHIRLKQEWKDELEDVVINKKDPYSMPLIPEIAVWNENRSELKSSLTLCDWAFPNPNNTKLESQLFSAVTGIEYNEEELDQVGERCKNMQRALLIRDYDRHFEKEFNEIMPWFSRPDGTQGISVDEDKFRKTVQEYYKQRHWDKNGRPTRRTLDSLGLNDIADELVRLGKITA